MAVEPAVNPEHHHRLLEGMAHAVAARGYGDTTIADIVREAAVSRRTFYEHFDSKSECLIALYEMASHSALKVLREALDPAQDWHAQVEQALQAYLGSMARNPVLLRTLFIEILALGPRAMAARRRVNLEIAQFILGVVNAPSASRADEAPLSPDMAMAIVGGVNELVLQYIEQGRAGALQELARPASELVRRAARG